MINKKRIMITTLAAAVMLSMLTACGGDPAASAPAPASETVTEEVEETKEPEVTEPADEEDGMGDSFDEEESADAEGSTGAGSEADQYMQAYLDEAKTLLEAGDADQFVFVNLDGDDIPELVASSSEGSWDKDQVFIYGINNGVAVLLVSDIAPGMEGHSLGFFEGENIIEVSGAAMGERYEYYSVRDGEIDQVFTLESYDDPEKDNETAYFVDGEEVDEAAYVKAAQDFYGSHGKLTTLGTEKMSVVSIDFSQGYRDTKEESTVPYKSFNDLK